MSGPDNPTELAERAGNMKATRHAEWLHKEA